MKTLIVDDIEKERKQLHHCLKKRGCTVIEAADGKEGLERAKSESPDLIISDGLMPRMDGFQFLRAVRKDPALKTVPFIFYSAAYVGSAEEELALSLGADAFIAKPKRPAQFWKELISVLENSNLKKGIRAKKING